MEKYVVQMPTNPRKLKRFLENEFYAKDARFWIGRVKSADRTGSLRPINRQAAAHLNVVRGHNRRKAMVYVVRFVLKSDPSVTFIKVGITGSNPILRFKIDEKKFRLEVIEQTGTMRAADALAMEAALLELFRDQQFRSPVPLASGNTECFVYTPDLQTKMKEIVNMPL